MIFIIYFFFFFFCVVDCSDCLNAETVVLLMTDGFGVFHIRMVLGKKEFWYVSVRAEGRLECSVLVWVDADESIVKSCGRYRHGSPNATIICVDDWVSYWRGGEANRRDGPVQTSWFIFHRHAILYTDAVRLDNHTSLRQVCKTVGGA